MKMLHIRERRRALVPTIIEGETGVGKTKLLHVYADIEAASQSSSCNILAVVRLVMATALKTSTKINVRNFAQERFVVDTAGATVPNVLRACVEAMDVLQHHDHTHIPHVLQVLAGVLVGPVLFHPLINVAQLLFWLESALVAPGSGEVVLTTEQFERFHTLSLDELSAQLSSMWEAALDSGLALAFISLSQMEVWSRVCKLAKEVSMRFEPSAKKPEKENMEDDEVVFELSASEAFARWCVVWLHARSAPMFRAVLMHAAYTVDDLRRDLVPTARYAERAMFCFSAHGLELAKSMNARENRLPTGTCDVFGGPVCVVTTSAALQSWRRLRLRCWAGTSAPPHPAPPSWCSWTK